MNFKEILPKVWKFQQYELDEFRRELRRDGLRLNVEAKPFDLLRVLVQNAGEVVSRENLCQAVWPGIYDADDSLSTAISKIRSALGDNGSKMVLTVPGLGYKFVEAVSGVLVGETGGHTIALREGDLVPGREQWNLASLLAEAPGAAVWLCLHRKTLERRVFKFAFDGARLMRLQREVAVSRLLARVEEKHSQFVRVLEWNFDSVPYFLESEYGGENLLAWSEARGGLGSIAVEDRLRLLARTCRAVAAAHNVGVIHKDLKPANILVNAEGEIRVSDFDLAWVMDPSRLADFDITNPGFRSGGDGGADSGTALYVAPEVLRGQPPSMASDVYALGVILYQLETSDFRGKLSAGWEREVHDPLIREDIASSASGSPEQRPGAAELAQRLETLNQRRVQMRELAESKGKAELAQRQLASARARLPWVVMTLAALMVGCVLSLSLLKRANREASRQEALNRFVSDDVLGQTNPFLSGSVHESLEDAISRASPDIDKKFHNEPLIAGHLHLEIARALDARSNFHEARPEYRRAVALFRQGDGNASEDAIQGQFQEASMEARTFQPGTLELAKSLLNEGDARLAELAHPRPELAVWRLSARGSIAMIEANARLAAENFAGAVSRASLIPDFDTTNLQTLEGYLVSSYLRIPDGASAERLCRQLIQEAAGHGDTASVRVFRFRTLLVQCFFVEGKYRDAIREADSVYPVLQAKLGTDHDVCIKILMARAAAAGHLGLFDRAIKDDLELYRIAAAKQGVSFTSLGSLSDAGLSQCRAGRYTEGEANTRKALAQSEQLPKQTGMTGAISYSLAICLIGENKLDQASGYLRNIDVESVVHLTGESSVAGDVALAEAEIALKRGDDEIARHYVQLVEKAFAGATVDEIDQKGLVKLQRALQSHESRGRATQEKLADPVLSSGFHSR